MKSIAVISVIKAQWPIARKRLGRTSGDRENSGKKKGGVTSQMETKQKVQDEREITPQDRT